MSTKLNRRDLLRFGGGAAAGILLTPVPWKGLDDVSIWTQNWSWTPKLSRGPITTRFTTCTLCPAGCGVKARCAAGVPVSLSGAAGHPVSAGALCPVGLTGHHLAYRPGRARQFLGRGRQAGLSDILEALRPARTHLAILDGRPGRTVSLLYQRFLSGCGQGRYLVSDARQSSTFTALRRLVQEPAGPFGLDLEHAKTLLSFGAPVLEDWATPGRIWRARPGFRLWQAESRHSRTGDLADQRLSIRPGAEGALALAIAHVLLRDGLIHPNAMRATDFDRYRKFLEPVTPETASDRTGLAAELIVRTAHEFAAGSPAVAISGGGLDAAAESAIAGLNLLVGSVGAAGGLLARREPHIAGEDIAAVEDGSLGALIVDASEPLDESLWPMIQKKLAFGAPLVCLTPFSGGLAEHADFIVAVPGHLESLKDIPSPFDSPVASLSLSLPLFAAPPEVMEPAQFLAQLAQGYGLPDPGPYEALRREQIAGIHAAGRGHVHPYDGAAPIAVAEIASAEQMWDLFAAGACWMDEPVASAMPRRFALMKVLDNSGEGLLRPAHSTSVQQTAIAPFGTRWEAGSWPVSPLWRV